jgi:3',5'-cyclic AMP phosphodiesterase CpdA
LPAGVFLFRVVRMATRLLHLSDLHFGTVVDSALDAVRRLIDHERPDVIVVSGDVTQRSRRSEWAGVSACLASLPNPLLVCAGNHDVEWFHLWRRLHAPLTGFHDAVDPELQHALVVGDLALATTSSVAPLRPVSGRIEVATVAAAATWWDTAAAPVRIAVTHHPLAIDRPARPPEVCLDAHATATAMATAHVDILLSGHVHVPFACTTAAAFSALSRPFVLVGTGTATSSRTRGAPRAVQVLDIERDRCVVRQHDHVDDGFCPGAVSRFLRTETGWHNGAPSTHSDRTEVL